MENAAALAGYAFWLGILTSISPCPLTTNIAAISFVGNRVGNPKAVFLAGLLYTFGRALAYASMGMVLVSSLLSAPTLSHILQKYMDLAMGPLMILVGLVLIGLITLPTGNGGLSETIRLKIEKMGLLGSFVLGVLFALSLCPTSAALFFGSLIPMAVKRADGIGLPLIYGIGTGFPVLLFAFLIALGANKVARAFNKITLFERWARKGTGIVFILAGLYYSATVLFGMTLWF
ncbi:MAG: aromatic aminobenezylarsenical efflux permease ArsG family transporter [Alphaproteobacteria bacterium]|nr:aromatic aminobenezylarsenical efflux permease ArsG family transporter [Alphaproteobacteria bacterium]